MEGQKFGRLKVVGKDRSDRHGHMHYQVRCDCGNVTVVRGDNLKSGRTKSCGCLRDEYYNTLSEVIDITGQVFGTWEVIELYPRDMWPSNQAYWRVRCVKCGEYRAFAGQVLREGRHGDCSCSMWE